MSKNKASRPSNKGKSVTSQPAPEPVAIAAPAAQESTMITFTLKSTTKRSRVGYAADGYRQMIYLPKKLFVADPPATIQLAAEGVVEANANVRVRKPVDPEKAAALAAKKANALETTKARIEKAALRLAKMQAKVEKLAKSQAAAPATDAPADTPTM